MNEKKVVEKYFLSLLKKKSQIKLFGKREQKQMISKKGF